MNDSELIKAAIYARLKSYSPYSGFMVGAALLTTDGKIYTGCNIENAAFSPTNCAERTAFFKAVSDGERYFDAIAVVGWHKDKEPDETDLAYPCGVCRQVMMEFCNPKNFRVIVASGEDNYKSSTLEQLLAHGFGPNSL